MLVSIDTLRADHLPSYGYTEGRTPALDHLAQEGILFENAYSQAPLTLPAHTSLLTGLLPPHHGVRDNVGFTLSPGHRTLATRLREAGYRTGAAVSAFVLRHQTGISQGFEFFDDFMDVPEPGTANSHKRDGERAVDALSGWIGSQGEAKVFAFLHLYEPHSPYAPPNRYRHFHNPYDGEIAYADELVGRLVQRVGPSSLIVVTADHGEGLGDHGESEHGILLYREAVHVPLIIRLPGAAHRGARIASVVSQVDIAPTILDLAGLPASGMDGISLKPALLGGVVEARPAYSETFYPRYHFGWSELFAVSSERYRFIRAPRSELYDLQGDPGERESLLAAQTTLAGRMEEWLRKTVDVNRVEEPGAVSDEVKEKLRALGYVSAPKDVLGVGSPPDPKDKIAEYEKARGSSGKRTEAMEFVQRGSADLLQGRVSTAREEFQEALARDPSLAEAHARLGDIALRTHRTFEAQKEWQTALSLDPKDHETRLNLAEVLVGLGRGTEARGLLERYLSEAPATSESGRKRARALLARLEASKGR